MTAPIHKTTGKMVPFSRYCSSITEDRNRRGKPTIKTQLLRLLLFATSNTLIFTSENPEEDPTGYEGIPIGIHTHGMFTIFPSSKDNINFKDLFLPLI